MHDVGFLAVAVAMAAFNWWGGRRIVGFVVRNMEAAKSGTGPGAGAVVGVLERLLVYTLILVGQWGVIGFVITAKSIARFKELEDKAFTDYYLAGTFTSWLVAVLTGLLTLWITGR